MCASLGEAQIGRQPGWLRNNVGLILLKPEDADAVVASGEDPEAVRKMQEEEFQRRLKGEYEEAQARVGSVVRPVTRRET